MAEDKQANELHVLLRVLVAVYATRDDDGIGAAVGMTTLVCFRLLAQRRQAKEATAGGKTQRNSSGSKGSCSAVRILPQGQVQEGP
jgi:hypothetical protein